MDVIIPFNYRAKVVAVVIVSAQFFRLCAHVIFPKNEFSRCAYLRAQRSRGSNSTSIK